VSLPRATGAVTMQDVSGRKFVRYEDLYHAGLRDTPREGNLFAANGMVWEFVGQSPRSGQWLIDLLYPLDKVDELETPEKVKSGPWVARFINKVLS